MQSCTRCGARIKRGAAFCPRCGRKVRNHLPGAVISFFFALALFILLCAGIFLHIIQLSTTPQVIAKAAEETDLAALADDIGLTKIITDAINGNRSEWLHVEPDLIDDLFREPAVKEFVAEKSLLYLNAFVAGEDTYGLTSEDIIRLLQKNPEGFERILGFPLMEGTYGLLQYALDASEAFEHTSIQAILSRTGIDPFALRTLLSDYPLMAALPLGAALLLLLILISRRLSLLWAALAFAIPGAFYMFVGQPSDYVINRVSGATGLRPALIETLFAQPRDAAFLYGCALLAAALICVVAFLILRRLAQKK
ncbi:MAG: zinc ribbon domain-containing protein [Clostridiales bacterium]|jgi:hypothetical protein|nr:zinc ribbon domain-containing protein [Clostridiales bacterium]